jgi:hypothetical protein
VYKSLQYADGGFLCTASVNPLMRLAIDPNVWSGRALQEVSSIWVQGSCINDGMDSPASQSRQLI